MKKDFEILPHTADLKIRAYGTDVKELFENSLKGMFSEYVKDLHFDTYESERLVEVESYDIESLLVDFLSEALYLSDVYKEAYIGVQVEEITDRYIKCVLCGVKIKKLDCEIKAVTRHDLKVEKKGDMWVSEVLYDL